MFTADQFMAHVVGDYVLQSEWMATQKGRRSLATLVHCLSYILPFLFLTQNPLTLAIIGGTHFIIDRWNLARYIVWIKNRPYPGSSPWEDCKETGFPSSTPMWLSGWLLIVMDNIMHITINGLALHYIG